MPAGLTLVASLLTRNPVRFGVTFIVMAGLSRPSVVALCRY